MSWECLLLWLSLSERHSADTCPVPPDDLIGVVELGSTLLTAELLAHIMGCVRPKPVKFGSLASPPTKSIRLATSGME